MGVGRIGDETSIPFLQKAITARFAVKSAILALGKIGSPVIAATMLKGLADKDETIRVLAAEALSQVALRQRFWSDFHTPACAQGSSEH